MEVTDINKNTTINILYKEVEIDNLEENNVLAFNLFNMSKQIWLYSKIWFFASY